MAATPSLRETLGDCQHPAPGGRTGPPQGPAAPPSIARRETTRRATAPPGGEPLADAIVGVGADKDGRPDARRLGHYLGAKVGSVVGGLTVEHRGDRQKVAQWGVAQRAGPRREAGG